MLSEILVALLCIHSICYVLSQETGSYFWSQTNANYSFYHGITTSGNGQYSTAVTYPGLVCGAIFNSQDYGTTWSIASISGNPCVSFWAVDSDLSGQYQYSVTNFWSGPVAGVYYSSNYGMNWTLLPNSPPVYYGGVATNSTGEFVAAGGGNGGVYVSNNSGNSWIIGSGTEGLSFWATACSSSGQIVISASYHTSVNNYFYMSVDFGQTWSSLTNVGLPTGATPWNDVAMSGSGQYMIAIQNGGSVFISSNTGESFAEVIELCAICTWHSAAMSTNGQIMAIVQEEETPIFISVDYGLTWIEQNSESASINSWSGITLSSGGDYVRACVFPQQGTGGITLGTNYSQPTFAPTISPSDGDGIDFYGRIAVSVLAGIFLFIFSAFAIYMRRNSSEVNELSTLKDIRVEFLDLSFKSVSIGMSIFGIISLYRVNSQLHIFLLLLLSRLVVVVGWLIFVLITACPSTKSKHQENDIDDWQGQKPLQSSLNSQKQASLFTSIVEYLNRNALKQSLHLACCCFLIAVSILDLTVLRYLPWTKTDLTTTCNGYPSLPITKLCVYGMFCAYILYAVGCTAASLHAHSHQAHLDADFWYVAETFSLFNVIKSFVTIIISVQLIQLDLKNDDEKNKSSTTNTMHQPVVASNNGLSSMGRIVDHL